MRKLWLGVVATLGLVACINFNTEPTPATDFEYVCQEVKREFDVECGDLPAPIIVRSKIVDILGRYMGGGLNGAYIFGEPYIFVNPLADDPLATEIHETGHYVITNLGIPLNVCEQEEFVRRIAEQPWDERIKPFYGCDE